MDFEYKTKIYGYECDIYSHLNNANYQHIYEAARSTMLDEIGLPLTTLLAEDIHIYVKRITLDYLKGVPFGSEIIVKSRIGTLTKVRSIWLQEIRTLEGLLMNKAIVEGIFARQGKPFRIPDEMYIKLLNCTNENVAAD